MKFEIVNIDEFSGGMAQIYSIMFEDDDMTLMDHFFDDNAQYAKELEEMAYLEQNYTNMNYKEMLSLSDHKYGFLHGYGAKLRDYRTSPYNNAFPVFDWYDYVVDGSLDDYTVINYEFVNGKGSVVLVDEENRQFVIIRLVSL